MHVNEGGGDIFLTHTVNIAFHFYEIHRS